MGRRATVASMAALLLMAPIVTRQVLAEVSCGEPVSPPKYYVGEKRRKDEKGAEWSNQVLQLEGGITQISGREADIVSFDQDMVIRKVVRPSGEIVTKQGPGRYMLVGQRVLDFPLHSGKMWEFTFPGQPRGGGPSQLYFSRSRIVACEEISTPAGRFSAFKVEVGQGLVDHPVSGVFMFWYAPQVKNTIRRKYVPSQWWSGGRFLDNELIAFEVK